ncbi:MAG TPA: M24 family metallopeptidase [Bryobacteraceae bacterium]|nr:M24 family metallopeptidase [Bryobacteraceae bacterium]
MLLENIQTALRKAQIDGWLFFDHHRRDPLAYRILGLGDHIEASRRWYYFVPTDGEPRKLVHRIESGTLDGLPGSKQSYSSWPDQQRKVGDLLQGARRIAMQYSPDCAIPYISLVDGGTLELVKKTGVEVLSSANLIQEFEARWTEEQFQSHLNAARLVDTVRREAFEFVGEQLRNQVTVTEYDVKQFVARRFKECGLFATHGPIVARNENASDPHYEPIKDRAAQIRLGDLVLIDMWAKLTTPNAVYYDITWMGFCGSSVPAQIQNVFEVVRDARKKASDFVIQQVAANRPVAGYEVDEAARGHIEAKGFGSYFFHRTGHSIGTEVHGNGANMDNLESHDTRSVIPRTCFSIEPGIYLAEFGIRSEVNVYVGEGFARVTGEEQSEIIKIVAG